MECRPQAVILSQTDSVHAYGVLVTLTAKRALCWVLLVVQSCSPLYGKRETAVSAAHNDRLLLAHVFRRGQVDGVALRLPYLLFELLLIHRLCLFCCFVL